MRGLLVRVGIDSTEASGKWHGPVRADTGEFVYVPIREEESRLRPELRRTYDEFVQPLKGLNSEIPERLRGVPCHLDPDFEYLTFGDQGQRGSRIAELRDNDLIAFFAALRPVDRVPPRLMYALIGLFVVDGSPVLARDIPPGEWKRNAHTRRRNSESDIIVRGKPGISGRLKRCLPIGEWRERAYRVTAQLRTEWDGLDIKGGYLQRSAHLPSFTNPSRFYDWFCAQHPELIASNN